MSNSLPPDLAQLEDRAYSASLNHGFADLMCALAFGLLGLTMLTEWDYLPIAIGFLYPALLLLRVWFVTPRLGQVRYSPERQAWLGKRLRVLGIMNLVIFILGVAAFMALTEKTDLGERFQHLGAIPFAAVIAMLLTVIGVAFQLRRVHLYGAVILLGTIFAVLVPFDPGWAMVGTGLLVLLAACVLIWRFFREYPLAEAEVNADTPVGEER